MVLLDWPPPDHLGIGRKISAIPASASILPRSWHSARAAPPTVAARTRIVSAAGIRLDHRESVRPFKGIFWDDISEFESSHPSQAVRSPPAQKWHCTARSPRSWREKV